MQEGWTEAPPENLCAGSTPSRFKCVRFRFFKQIVRKRRGGSMRLSEHAFVWAAAGFLGSSVLGFSFQTASEERRRHDHYDPGSPLPINSVASLDCCGTCVLHERSVMTEKRDRSHFHSPSLYLEKLQRVQQPEAAPCSSSSRTTELFTWRRIN